MLDSRYRPLCRVSLPYAGRQRYMHGFDLAAPVMADGFEDYLEPVVALCTAAGARTGTAFMTVDEKLVGRGATQRRPGPHVDGCFVPAMHDASSGSWRHTGSWNHVCNDVPVARMPIIVVASVAGCRAWRGEFDAVPTDQGDLTHAAHLFGKGEVLPADVGYLLSPDCVHESLPFAAETRRTFLRIALPVGFADGASGR